MTLVPPQLDESDPASALPLPLDDSVGSLGEQLRQIHDRIMDISPDVSRMACALYESQDDLLKTFINSTRSGIALRGYQYRLSDSLSLSEIARTRQPRLLTDIPTQLVSETEHTKYVKSQGYRSSFTVPMYHRGDLLGFVFFDSENPEAFTPEVLRQLVLHSSLITLAIAHDMVAIGSVVSTIQIARDFTQLRDNETAHHMDRMARYSRLMARDAAAEFGLGDEQVEHIFLFAPMHDLGKIGIPDRILLKPGPLDEDEWEIMRSHTTLGAGMIDSILRDLEMVDVPDRTMLRNIVELHHEKLDGSGYPHGRRGDSVPVEARIVAVADVFDALTSERPYKKPWPIRQAFEELHRLVDLGQIDGRLVAALEANRLEIDEIRAAYPN